MNKLKWNKILAMFMLLSIFSVSTMPLTQVKAADVCCDNMNKVQIVTPGSGTPVRVQFDCFKHGAVYNVEACYETEHYNNVIIQCTSCRYISSSYKDPKGVSHSNPHH